MEFFKRKASARDAESTKQESSSDDAAGPKRTPSTSKSASPKAPAERDPLFNYDTQLSAVDHVDLLGRQIMAYQRQITSRNKTLKDVQDELDAIPTSLFGHHKPLVDRLENRKQDCLNKVEAAKASLLQKQQEKKEWSVLAKQQKDKESAAKKAADAESEQEDRWNKLRAYHDELDTSYKGTARSPSTGIHAPRRPAMPFSKSGYKNLSRSSTGASPKRKREEEQDEEIAIKKMKSSSTPSAITAKDLADFPRIPKKSKSPSDEATVATERTTHTSTGNRGAKKSSKSATVQNSSKASPKGKQLTPAASSSKEASKQALKGRKTIGVKPTQRSSPTPPSSPDCDDDDVKLACGFVRTFDPLGDLKFIEHELDCAQCQSSKAPELKGILGLNDKGAFNCALQLLNAALTDDQVAAFIGNSTPSDFGLSEAECINHANGNSRSTQQAKFENKIEHARRQIAAVPDKDSLLLAPYVGQVLQRLRTNDYTETSALLAHVVCQAKAGTEIKHAAGLLTSVLMILGQEHDFVDEGFGIQFQESSKCSSIKCNHSELIQYTSLVLPVEAQDPELLVFEEDDEEMEEEVKATLDVLIAKTVGCTGEGSFCQKCKKSATLHTTKQVSQYPPSLIVAIDRSQSSAWVECGVHGIKVGEKKYKTETVVHQGTGGHLVNFLQLKGGWWKASDEDVEKIKDFQVQDNLRSQWVLVVLKQV